jgi:sugar O-acyltransferase (sialic acid O-acetyltransferase NeuD family)
VSDPCARPACLQDLAILGIGAHAQEMAEIVERVNAVRPRWRLRGYLSHNGRQVGDTLNGYPVLGGPDGIGDLPEVVFSLGFVWPRPANVARERLVTLVDPTCFVSRTATVGAGCVLYPGCFVGANARIGDGVFCLSGVAINHDDVVEDNVSFASGATLAGQVRVEADCYLGQSCTVRQGLRVGRRAFIGMGAVVVKDVPPEAVMAGNPARKLRDRRPDAGRGSA